MRNSIVGLLFVLLFMVVLIPLPGARASAATIPHGTVDLVAENQWIAPGSQTYFGLNFHLEKGWHIYWVNPGDSGQPPRVQLHLPAGLSEGEIEWPAPRRLGTSTIVDFGYDDAVMLLVPVRASSTLPTNQVAQIAADLRVLVCREICVPGKANISLALPTKSMPPEVDARSSALITAARKSLPRQAPRDWDFTVTASNNQTYHLADFRGKFVVLEWHNNGCPYTQKHYMSGNMQKLQKQWTAQGVVWFTIISSAQGKQGYVDADGENKYMAKMGAAPTAALLDPTGAIGHSYDAKTTPQMIVINPQGVIIYDGAIDNRPTDDVKDIAGATNYLNVALGQALAGKPVETAATRPYGCSVKYKGSWF